MAKQTKTVRYVVEYRHHTWPVKMWRQWAGIWERLASAREHWLWLKEGAKGTKARYRLVRVTETREVVR